MKTTKITISEGGQVRIPQTVSMRVFEVAHLFGVYEQTITANVRAIIKSGIILPDTSGGAIIGRSEVIPLNLGLDMITALAFRINSAKAQVFRQWIIGQAVNPIVVWKTPGSHLLLN